MNDRDRQVLAAVAKLNNDMGQLVLTLTSAVLADGRLPPARLRDLACICDDLSALLDNRADEIDPRDVDHPPVVVTS